jgi:ribonuclease H2 subunit A
VIRDQCLRTWQFKEKGVEFSREFGSGYPADPFTKQWLEGSLDKLFGYPTLIRFSWATTDNMLEDHDAHAVAWYCPLPYQRIVVMMMLKKMVMVMSRGAGRRM